MSMLTPPGMGGKYRITGDQIPADAPPPRPPQARARGRRVRRRPRPGRLGHAAAHRRLHGGRRQRPAAAALRPCRTATTQGAATSAAAAPRRPPSCCRSRARSPSTSSTPRPAAASPRTPRTSSRSAASPSARWATPPKEYDKKVKGTGMLLGAKAATDTSLPVLGTQLAGAEQNRRPQERRRRPDHRHAVQEPGQEGGRRQGPGGTRQARADALRRPAARRTAERYS